MVVEVILVVMKMVAVRWVVHLHSSLLSPQLLATPIWVYTLLPTTWEGSVEEVAREEVGEG